MLGKSVYILLRVSGFSFFYIYRPIYRNIGFLNHQIFALVTALKIPYRSGSSVCLCVCVCAHARVRTVLFAFIFWALCVSIITKHWLSESLSPTADRALRKDLYQVTGNTRTRLRGLRELWAETLTIALLDQEEEKPLGRPSGLNPFTGRTAPDRGQTPDEPGEFAADSRARQIYWRSDIIGKY